MSLKQRSIYGLFWEFAGRIGLQSVGFIVSIILARILAPEDFGLLAIINVFIALAGVFLDFGFSKALIQRAEVNETHYAAVFYLNVSMGLILAAGTFFLAPIVGAFYNKEILVNLTRFMALGFIVNSLGNVIRARLRREMNFKIISVVNVAAAFFSGVIAIVMAWKGFGVWSLAVQSVANQLMANVMLYFFYPVPLSLGFRWQGLKDLWGFSSRMFASGFIDTLFINLDSLLIGKLLTPATLGYYHRAKSLERFTFRYTAATLASVLLPSLSSLQNEPERLRHAVLKVFHLLSFISFLSSGLLLVSSREIIILLFSAKWEPSVIMFQIIIAGAFGPQIFSLFYNVLLSTGRANQYFLINLTQKTLLGLNLAMLFFWSLTYYLVAFSAVRIFILYVTMIIVSKQLNFGSKLVRISARHLSIFAFGTAAVFLIKGQLDLSNLLVSLLFSSGLFAILFIVLTCLFNKETFQAAIQELFLPVKAKIQALTAKSF